KAESDGKIFGWIVENSDLRAAMMKAIAGLKNVTHTAPAKVKDFQVEEDLAKTILESGDIIASKLIVGADGKKSFTRDWMDVPVRDWAYDQRAVICTAAHERPHHNAAVEHFWPEGPFAILPMSDAADGTHRSSVVFTEHGPEKTSVMRLDDEAFNAELQ